MPEARLPAAQRPSEMEEREIWIRVIVAGSDSAEKSVVALQQRWFEADLIPRERPRSSEVEHREEHAKLVRTQTPMSLVDDETLELVLIVRKAHRAKAKTFA